MMEGLFGVDVHVLVMSCVLVVAVGLSTAGCATKPKVPDDVIPEGRTCEELLTEKNEKSEEGGDQSSSEIPKASIQSAFEKHHEQLKSCYKNALKSNSELEGKVTYYIELVDTGEFERVHPCQTNIPHRGIHDCLTNEIRDIEIPVGERDSPIVIIYPFVFTPLEESK
jgi:hypothetical protein